MRYIQLTHTYTIPVPADDQEAIEPIARQGMEIMENFMKDRAANIQEMRSDWTLLPKEYRPRQPTPGDDTIIMTPAEVPKKFTNTPRERDLRRGRDGADREHASASMGSGASHLSTGERDVRRRDHGSHPGGSPVR